MCSLVKSCPFCIYMTFSINFKQRGFIHCPTFHHFMENPSQRMCTNPSKQSPEFLKREKYLIFLFGTTLSPSLFASLWWHRSKGHRNDELHCREIHFLPIWANTVNKPHWVEAAKRQQQKSKFGWEKTLLSHSRILHDPKTVSRSDFDQETAEKIAPQFIARLELANCTCWQR